MKDICECCAMRNECAEKTEKEYKDMCQFVPMIWKKLGTNILQEKARKDLENGKEAIL